MLYLAPFFGNSKCGVLIFQIGFAAVCAAAIGRSR
jgi:hypothetical protein